MGMYGQVKDPKWAYLQGVLARGDRRVGELLLLALKHRGDWRRAFREWPGNGDYYACRERALDERFPWDHFEVGTKRDRLEVCDSICPAACNISIAARAVRTASPNRPASAYAAASVSIIAVLIFFYS
jgi:hypothetical protein